MLYAYESQHWGGRDRKSPGIHQSTSLSKSADSRLMRDPALKRQCCWALTAHAWEPEFKSPEYIDNLGIVCKASVPISRWEAEAECPPEALRPAVNPAVNTKRLGLKWEAKISSRGGPLTCAWVPRNMHVCTRTHLQMCMHKHTHAHIHIHSHKHTQTHKYVTHYLYTQTRTLTHTTLTPKHALPHTLTHNTRSYKHSYTHTLTHIYIPHSHTHTYTRTPHTSTHAPETDKSFLIDGVILVVPWHFMKVGSFASQPPLPFFMAILKGAIYHSVLLFSIHVYYGKMHMFWNWLSWPFWVQVQGHSNVCKYHHHLPTELLSILCHPDYSPCHQDPTSCF